MKKFTVTALIILSSCSLILAQEKVKPEPVEMRNWEIGLNTGISNFTGEYLMHKPNLFSKPYNWNSSANFGYGVFVKKNFTSSFALELAWNYSDLTGSRLNANIPSVPSSYDFKTKVNEFDLSSVWNIINIFSKNKFDRKINWFGKIGMGISNVRIKEGDLLLNGNNMKQTYNVGTDVVFRLSEKVRLNIGTKWSWIDTDRLDGYETKITSNNVKAGDHFPYVMGTKLYTHIGISWIFGKGKNSEPDKGSDVISTPINK